MAHSVPIPAVPSGFGILQRPCRYESDLWPRQPLWRDAPLVQSRSCRAAVPHRDGLRRLHTGHRRCDTDDPTTSRGPVGDYLADIEGGVKGLRLGVPGVHFFDDVDDDVREAIEASIEVFRKLGAEIVRVEVPGIKHGFALGEVLGRVEAATYHSTWLRERPEDYGTQTRNRLMELLLSGNALYRSAEYAGQLLSGSPIPSSVLRIC